MSSKISPCCFWDEIPTQPSSISRTVYRNSSKCLQRSHRVLSGTKSPPNLPLFPHGPSDTCRSLAENDEARRWPDDSWEKAWGKLGGGCGDYSWRNGKLPKWRKLVATKNGAKGGGDYSWRTSRGSLRSGANRLRSGANCLRSGANYRRSGAKCLRSGAKWRELPAKWREVAAKWREVPAKWREVAAKKNCGKFA